MFYFPFVFFFISTCDFILFLLLKVIAIIFVTQFQETYMFRQYIHQLLTPKEIVTFLNKIQLCKLRWWKKAFKVSRRQILLSNTLFSTTKF